MKLLNLALSKAQTKLSTFTVLMGVSLILPAVIHNQLITGPIINALLFSSVALVGAEQAILVGLIPSTVAVSRGLLPIAMAPMMPFIMMSNTILILLFARLRKIHPWLGIAVSSVLKAIFLSAVSYLIMPGLVPSALTNKLQAGMSWVQLMTALVGGLIYWLIFTQALDRKNETETK